MAEITPDLSNANRCISVHWSLPVQCERDKSHFDNWHWARHPDSGRAIRYRRTFGIYRTEEVRADGQWHDLPIPPPEVKDVAAQLVEAIADRDRAREIAVVLEQQLAEIKEYAYMGGQNGEIVRRWILGVFERDRRALEGGEDR